MNKSLQVNKAKILNSWDLCKHLKMTVRVSLMSVVVNLSQEGLKFVKVQIYPTHEISCKFSNEIKDLRFSYSLLVTLTTCTFRLILQYSNSL